jgi:hypothetical protein
MKYSFSFLFVCLLSFIIVFSCSTEEEESVAPVVQTPQQEPEPEPVEYTLTVSAADGGTVSTEGGTYEEGSEVTITASASEGYRFTGWEGNSSTSESLTVTLNSNQTYLALFELIPIYTLTVTTGEGGTISTEGGTFEEGTIIAVTATPSEGYEFVGWESSDESTYSDSFLEIPLDKSFTLTALFQPTQQTLIDSDGDGVVDSEDDFPFNSSLSRDLWGEKLNIEPELFFSNDIPLASQEKFRNDLMLAVEEWGIYSPVEYWVLGRDISSAIDLAKIYCQRRIERGEYFKDELENVAETEVMNICLVEMMYPETIPLNLDYSISNLNKIFFEEDLSNFNGDGTGRLERFRKVILPRTEAVASSKRDWGICLIKQSFPYQYENNQWGYSKEDITPTIFHEYFHAVNYARVTSEEYVRNVYVFREGTSGSLENPDHGPPFFKEGSAMYISEYTLRKLINEGKYQKSAGWNFSLRDLMRGKMENLQEKISNCPNFNHKELFYTSLCDAYTFGMWGVAYLLDKIADQDAYQNVLFPLLDQLGWEAAFQATFGINTQQFNQEFLEFLELPIEEQLEIIPDI